jgi:hypothetical protein
MKKVISVVLVMLALSCYKKDDDNYNDPPANNGGNNADCGTYNGYQLYKDSEGCYYNGGNYSKVYVDASNCTCE